MVAASLSDWHDLSCITLYLQFWGKSSLCAASTLLRVFAQARAEAFLMSLIDKMIYLMILLDIGDKKFVRFWDDDESNRISNEKGRLLNKRYETNRRDFPA